MSQRQANGTVVADCQGEQTNPTTATVMADTGALGAEVGGGGTYEILVVVGQTALAEYQLQRRNAANGALVGDALIFYGPANNTVAIPFRLEAERGERFRVMMNANLTGDAVASIMVQRVA